MILKIKYGTSCYNFDWYVNIIELWNLNQFYHILVGILGIDWTAQSTYVGIDWTAQSTYGSWRDSAPWNYFFI